MNRPIVGWCGPVQTIGFMVTLFLVAIPGLSQDRVRAPNDRPTPIQEAADATVVGDPAPVRVGLLIYGRLHQGRCFSEGFLQQAARETAIVSTGRLHDVNLNEDDLSPYVMLILAGDRAFQLTGREQERLKDYLQNQGFLLVSAGCGSASFDRAFRRQIATIFPDQPLQPLSLDHPVFHMVKTIPELRTNGGPARSLWGLTLDGRLVLIYAPDGLHDSNRLPDCCCCGGQELLRASDINLNILAYVLGF